MTDDKKRDFAAWVETRPVSELLMLRDAPPSPGLDGTDEEWDEWTTAVWARWLGPDAMKPPKPGVHHVGQSYTPDL